MGCVFPPTMPSLEQAAIEKRIKQEKEEKELIRYKASPGLRNKGRLRFLSSAKHLRICHALHKRKRGASNPE